MLPTSSGPAYRSIVLQYSTVQYSSVFSCSWYSREEEGSNSTDETLGLVYATMDPVLALTMVTSRFEQGFPRLRMKVANSLLAFLQRLPAPAKNLVGNPLVQGS